MSMTARDVHSPSEYLGLRQALREVALAKMEMVGRDAPTATVSLRALGAE